MYGWIKTLLMAAVVCATVQFAAPEVEAASQYWDGYWSWYDNDYRSYYNQRYRTRSYPYQHYNRYNNGRDYRAYYRDGYNTYDGYGRGNIGRHTTPYPHNSAQIGPLHFDWR